MIQARLLSHYEEQLCALVEEYEANEVTNKNWTEELSLAEITKIVHFHISVVEPLTEQWALASLPFAPAQAQSAHRLSDIDLRLIQLACFSDNASCMRGGLVAGVCVPFQLQGQSHWPREWRSRVHL